MSRWHPAGAEGVGMTMSVDELRNALADRERDAGQAWANARLAHEQWIAALTPALDAEAYRQVTVAITTDPARTAELNAAGELIPFRTHIADLIGSLAHAAAAKCPFEAMNVIERPNAKTGIRFGVLESVRDAAVRSLDGPLRDALEDKGISWLGWQRRPQASSFANPSGRDLGPIEDAAFATFGNAVRTALSADIAVATAESALRQAEALAAWNS